MFCPNCGKKNLDEAKFCEGCGTLISDQPNGAPTQTAYAPPAPPPPSAAPPAQPVYTAPVQQSYVPPAYNPVPQAQPSYYQQPAYPANDLTKPMSVGSYIGTWIVMAIPLVGIIMILVWAFGSNVNINKKNFCRAILIMALIGAAISIVLSIVFAAFLPDLIDSFNSYGY